MKIQMLAVWVAVGMWQGAAWASDETIKLPPAGKDTVTFDGHVSQFEYAGAFETNFVNGHGQVKVRMLPAGDHLYFALEIPDPTVHPGDDIVVMLDAGNKKSAKPDAGSIRAYVRRKSENSRMDQGDGKTWVNLYGPFEYKSASYTNGWEVECRIPLSALPIKDGKPAPMGLMYRIWDNEPQTNWVWPAGGDENKPVTWAALTF